jgi:hypothetical protein
LRMGAFCVRSPLFCSTHTRGFNQPLAQREQLCSQQVVCSRWRGPPVAGEHTRKHHLCCSVWPRFARSPECACPLRVSNSPPQSRRPCRSFVSGALSTPPHGGHGRLAVSAALQSAPLGCSCAPTHAYCRGTRQRSAFGVACCLVVVACCLPCCQHHPSTPHTHGIEFPALTNTTPHHCQVCLWAAPCALGVASMGLGAHVLSALVASASHTRRPLHGSESHC